MIRNFEYVIVFTSAPGVLPEQNDWYRIQPWKVDGIKAYKKKVNKKGTYRSWAVFFVDDVIVYFPLSFFVFSCYWRPPYPTFTLPYLILYLTSYLTFCYLTSYHTLPCTLTHILPFVTLYPTLSYLVPYLTLPYILPYLTSYLTLHFTLPYVLP